MERPEHIFSICHHHDPLLRSINSWGIFAMSFLVPSISLCCSCGGESNASSLSLGGSLLLSSSYLAGVVRGGLIVVLFLVVVVIDILAMGARWHPEPAFTVFQTLILTRKVDALRVALTAAGFAALGESLCPGAQLRLYSRIGSDPVREGVFTVLDDPGNQVCVRK